MGEMFLVELTLDNTHLKAREGQFIYNRPKSCNVMYGSKFFSTHIIATS